MRVLSLGAGVQSSTILLLSCKGLLPKLDAAIFADTGWEPQAVYDHLWWLAGEAAQAGIPLYVVRKGNIKEDASRSRMRKEDYELLEGGRWASMPYYTKAPTDLTTGQIRRQCTSEYKLRPIEHFEKRSLLGLSPRQRVPADVQIEQWIGISIDEKTRMRLSTERWRTNHYPLIGWPTQYLDRPWSRVMCQAWLAKEYPHRTVPRSACIGCPFHTNQEWRRMKETDPVSWQDAITFDAAIRQCGGMRGQTFLHRSCVPLANADLSLPEEHSGWKQECLGMCGV
jgi:hypothetical protein